MKPHCRTLTRILPSVGRARKSAGFLLSISLLSSALAFSPEVESALQIPDLNIYAQFGADVDVSGDTVVVGCPGFKVDNARVGAAFVFVLRDGQWVHQATLLPQGLPAETEFGYSVAINQDTIVVGAYRDADFGSYSGAAYVFTRTQDIWTLDSKLSPTDAQPELQFGDPVVTNGDRIVVGAIGDNDLATASGAVYLFRREADTWQQEAKLKSNIPVAGALFGLSTSIEDGLLAVGAPFHSHNSIRSAGAAYLFELRDDAWIQTAELTADDATASSLLGWSVAVSSDRLLAGAPRGRQNDVSVGAAYLFQRFDTGWAQADKLTDLTPLNNAWFGYSAALDADLAVVGASQDAAFGSSAGSLCLYAHQDGAWHQTLKFNRASPAPGSQLGFSVALDNQNLIVGAPFQNDPLLQTGAAIVFSPFAPPPNECPIADASATPTSILSLTSPHAEVILDGSRSFDPDGSMLSFRWLEDGILIADTEIAAVVLPIGRHTLQLEVHDGSDTGTDSLELEVVLVSQAIDRLISKLQTIGVPAGQSKALEASLISAQRAADRDKLDQSIHHLEVAEHYLEVQAGKQLDPIVAQNLGQAIQELAEALRSF